ncbi:MAG: type II CAAX prenyl endopeptidase Rce1 family protein [Deferrisomatales bacterium]
MSAGLALGASGFFAWAALADGLLGWGGVAGLGILCARAAAAGESNDPSALHLTLLLFSLSLLPRLFPADLPPWPWKVLLPLLAYLGLAACVPRLRRSWHWLRPGRLGAREALFAGGLAAAGALGAGVWAALAAPDLAPYRRSLPALAPWLVAPAGAGFALLNAAMEEAVFRGAILGALERCLRHPSAALGLQALLFGVLHYREGFPSGVSGVALTAVYGLGLGVLRGLSGGLAAPWLAHAGADAAVYALVVRSARVAGGG